MFEEGFNKAYLVYKGINTLIFSNNFYNDFELVTSIFNMDTFGTLCMLETIVTNYRSIMDNKMKENIGNLINYYRYDVDTFSKEEKEKACEVCNEIIKYINNSDNKEKQKYISLELKSRGFCFSGIVNGIKKENLDKTFLEIKTYNVIDFYLLCALSDIFSDFDYNSFEKYLIDPNVPTIYCITGIINEYPELLTNENFRNKLKNSLELVKSSLDKVDENVISKRNLEKEYKKYEHLIRKVCI